MSENTLAEYDNGSLSKEEEEDLKETLIKDEWDNSDSAIRVSHEFCRIPSLGLKLAQGTYCYKDEKTNELTPDFCLTLVYEEDETDFQQYLYWEQDSPIVTLWNWLTTCGENKFKNWDDIGKIPCSLEHP